MNIEYTIQYLFFFNIYSLFHYTKHFVYQSENNLYEFFILPRVFLSSTGDSALPLRKLKLSTDLLIVKNKCHRHLAYVPIHLTRDERNSSSI